MLDVPFAGSLNTKLSAELSQNHGQEQYSPKNDRVIFAFEADFIESLRCIPMQVRYKLDTCGIKLKLHHWHSFSHADRQQLTQMPCATSDEIQSYRKYLCDLVIEATGDRPKDLPIDPEPDWLNPSCVPDVVIKKAQTLALEISRNQWASLKPLQRFALIKLSRSGHENRNFLPAATEFGLVPPHYAE
jgi:hypothetical protein